MIDPNNLHSAHDVSEYLLQRTGRALMTRDVELFESCMILPQHIETFEGRIFCETSEHFRLIFFSVVNHLRRSGVTELVRRCVAAEFIDENTVEATHEARLLAGTRSIQPAYPVFSVLKRVEGVWKISYSMYAITDAPAYSRALVNTPSPNDPEGLRIVN